MGIISYGYVLGQLQYTCDIIVMATSFSPTYLMKSPW